MGTAILLDVALYIILTKRQQLCVELIFLALLVLLLGFSFPSSTTEISLRATTLSFTKLCQMR